MEFIFSTNYNLNAFTIMSKALRKTIRKNYNRNSHIIAFIVIGLSWLLLFINDFSFDFGNIISILAMFIITIALFFEDKLNAYFALKKMVKGTRSAVTTFKEDSFICKTDISETNWQYESILFIVENSDYLIFIHDNIHAQVYDKNNIKGGSIEEFKTFIKDKTKKDIQSI